MAVPLGLRDLLERIRPAGAPGAPADGAMMVDRASAEELAALRAQLHDLDLEADEIVERARIEADDLTREADSEARSIRAGLPDRVAQIGESEAPATDELVRRRLAEVREATTASIERRRRAADANGDRIVQAALDTIWGDVGLEGSAGR